MKHIAMVLYGEPGVGKSTFAAKAPKPFFITTDRNYEYLKEVGAKEEDHIRVHSWAEAKKVFQKEYSDYETIVVDLTEDLFKWCEYEFCRVNGLDDVSDMGYGKAYRTTRNDFFINICKLLDREDKNVILIMHSITSTIKDRRGIEHMKYNPTDRIPGNVMEMIEGRVRFFVRAYLTVEDVGGKLIKKRFLSLVPKENEYGIARGIDENSIPSDIPLDFDTFADVIGLEVDKKEKKEKVSKQNEVKVDDIKPEKIEEMKKVLNNSENNTIAELQQDTTTVDSKEEIESILPVKEEPAKVDLSQYAILTSDEPVSKPIEEKSEEVIDDNIKLENVEEPKKEYKELTKEEKIAKLMARINQNKK